jgi:hypothetical protein
MLRRFFITSGLVMALAGTSIGTAHAATVSPASWAPKFCTALQEWQTDISTQGDELTSALEGVTDLDVGRQQVAAFLGRMVTATNTATRAVQKSGTPSSPNGDKIAAKIVVGLKAASKEFGLAKTKALKLSTSSPTAFQTDGKKLGQDLSNAGNKVTQSFNGIDKLDKGKKLSNAIEAAPECAFLNS